MAQDLGEQINTIERALGERMIDHALVTIRSWLTELGENNPFEEAFLSIQKQYNDLFSEWLSVDDEQIDERLNVLTGDTYQLVDAVYAAIRLQRGIAPDMHGYNKDNLNSLANYFFHCVKLQKADIEWLREIFQKETIDPYEHTVLVSLFYNIRECFSVEKLCLLIEGMHAKDILGAGICRYYVLKLLIQYDVRIDYFPMVQKAFVEAIQQDGDDGANMFENLWSVVRHPSVNQTQEQDKEYHDSLLRVLPDSWIYELLVLDHYQRENILNTAYLESGHNELMWDKLEFTEKWLCGQLRDGKKTAYNYINYGHCVLLRGDRMMAFELYKQARQKCKSAKEFYALFRPDRRALMDRGVPLEQIYLIEDRLINP